ncbi:uncharacterized protein LOC100898360 [Galendromus occidentalis]|uniref:Uncharacterized protein LOC100898360 n=1 Tax=Galendromus occidentalis TaxID=34638 RepID=A0AAJ6QUR8_9ACAR|nr:uncharacterized protein LOC100898360 [Galendromus occidentalis]
MMIPVLSFAILLVSGVREIGASAISPIDGIPDSHSEPAGLRTLLDGTDKLHGKSEPRARSETLPLIRIVYVGDDDLEIDPSSLRFIVRYGNSVVPAAKIQEKWEDIQAEVEKVAQENGIEIDVGIEHRNVGDDDNETDADAQHEETGVATWQYIAMGVAVAVVVSIAVASIAAVLRKRSQTLRHAEDSMRVTSP